MNRVDFIDWLHTEIDAVLYGEQSKEQLLLKAIPMVDLMLQKCEQAHVIGSADILPLKDEVKSEVKRLWALPPDYNSPPKVAAVKLVMQYYRDNGVECGIKKAKEVIEQHCL